LFSFSAASYKLADVPIIGEFFNVLSLGSGVVGSIANFFGFSRPSNTAVGKMIKVDIDDMALTDIDDHSYKLSVTRNQACDTGSAYLMCDMPDPLAITTIAGTDSIVGAFNWQTSDSAGTVEFTLPIQPLILGNNNLSALAFVSSFFQYWTGSLIVRLDVICTNFHRGRLIVYHLPEFGHTSPLSVSTALHNCILDITGETSKEFIIHNATPCPILNTGTAFNVGGGYNTSTPSTGILGNSTIVNLASGTSTGSTSGNIGVNNGFLEVMVDSPLLSPSTGANVVVVVSVRAGPDFQLLSPTGAAWQSQQFVATSAMLLGEPIAKPTSIKADSSCVLVPPIYVYSDFVQLQFGEIVSSLRGLMKRYNYEGAVPFGQGTGVGSTIATGLVTVGYIDPIFFSKIATLPSKTDVWNYRNTFQSIVLAGFAGYRTSMRLKFVPMYNTSQTPTMLTVSRFPQHFTFANYIQSTLSPNNNIFGAGSNTSGPSALSASAFGILSDSAAGMALSTSNSPIEVHFPYDYNLLYKSIETTAQFASTIVQNGYPCYKLGYFADLTGVIASNSGVHVFKACADDLQVFNWIGVPPLSATLDAINFGNASGATGTGYIGSTALTQ